MGADWEHLEAVLPGIPPPRVLRHRNAGYLGSPSENALVRMIYRALPALALEDPNQTLWTTCVPALHWAPTQMHSVFEIQVGALLFAFPLSPADLKD